MKKIVAFLAKNSGWAILALMLISSAIIRIGLVDKSFYTGDVHEFISLSESIIRNPENMVWQYGAIGSVQIGYGSFMPYLFSLFLLVWNNNIYTLFLFGLVLWGTAAVFVYLIGKEFFNRYAGIISAMLVCFHTFSVFSTTHNMNGSWSAPFIAMLVYSVFRIKFKDDSRFWILAFASTAILLQVHVSVFIAPLILILPLFFKPRINRRHIPYFLIGGIIFLLLMMPYSIYTLDENNMASVYEYLSKNKETGESGLMKFDILPKPMKEINFLLMETLFAVLTLTAAYFAFRWSLIRKKSTGLEKTDKILLQKIILLALIMTILYLWLTLFTYQSNYSFTALFIVACLVVGYGFGSAADFFAKRRWLWATIIIYAVVLAWMIFNVVKVGSFVERCSMGCYDISLEKEIAGFILRQQEETSPEIETPKKVGAYPKTIIYHGNLFMVYDELGMDFEMVKTILDGKDWITQEDDFFLVINESELPYDRIKAKSKKELSNGKQLIMMKNELQPEYRFSTWFKESWYKESFNDADWYKDTNQVMICSIINCLGPDQKLFDTDLFLRVKANNYYNDSAKTLIIFGKPFLIKEFFINGEPIDDEQFNKVSREVRVREIQKHMNKTENNILAMHFVININGAPDTRLLLFTKEDGSSS
ncbi:MAG: glycosyltransferase family 39 protein [archaeon]